MDKKKTVGSLLRKYDKLSKEMGMLNFHLNVLTGMDDDKRI